MRKLQELVKRVDELTASGREVAKTEYKHTHGPRFVSEGQMAGFRAACLSFIHSVYGAAHPHYLEFERTTKTHFLSTLEAALAMLSAIRSEIEGGWLLELKMLVTAEVFADFIEMAEHLLETGYKDPAAVMIGSVLEEHLRQLCAAHSVDVNDQKNSDSVPKKADRLNADLAKAGAYTKLDQKQITGWLDLRNNAAHGKYQEYSSEQVALMKAGVVEFMTRVPQ